MFHPPLPPKLVDATTKRVILGVLADRYRRDPNPIAHTLAVHAVAWSDILAADLATNDTYEHPHPETLTPITTADAAAWINHWRSLLAQPLTAEQAHAWHQLLTDPTPYTGLTITTPQPTHPFTRAAAANLPNTLTHITNTAAIHSVDAATNLHHNRIPEAIVAARRSDLASFRAWLLRRSHRTQDHAFLQADLIWDTAALVLRATRNPGTGFGGVLTATRARLSWTLPANEQQPFLQSLAVYHR